MSLQKIVTSLLVGLIVFSVAKTLWPVRQRYLIPFDAAFMKASYERSQYVQEAPQGWLPDEFHFAYAAWYYLQGGSPILVNPDYPPLGKYFIGLSIKLFGSDKIPSLLFGCLSLVSLFLLAKLFLKKAWLALIPVVIFASGRLYLEQLIYVPLMETFALTFLNLTLYFFIKAQDLPKYFWLSSLFLGALWATKPWMLTIPLLCSWLIYFLFFQKKLKMLFFWAISLFLGLAVLLLSYFKLFLEGWGIYKVLSVQKWIFWYHQSKIAKFGSVWPYLFLNKWHVWWGEQPVLPVVQWRWLWPLFTVLALIYSILVLTKKTKFAPRVQILCLWVLGYLAFLSFGNITSRYVFYLLPYCYLLGTCLFYETLAR